MQIYGMRDVASVMTHTIDLYLSLPPPPTAIQERESSVTNAVNLHASVRLLLGEIASQSQIRDADVPVLVE